MNIYDIEVTAENGETYKLEKYKGHPMVIVNTATKCGLAPQFAQLEDLYQTYKNQGLVVLGFPSNQFKQELSSSSEAGEACRMTYGVSFPMHDLVQVNGKDTSELFKYLKSHSKGLLGSEIKWNFTKFLVDRNGEVVERFGPKTNPKDMVSEIEKVI